MQEMTYNGEVRAKIWAPVNSVEESAIAQIRAMMTHPLLFKHLAIMPDVHAGIGATIGSVIPLRGGVIPSAVGVDIGCGMVVVKTSLKIDDICDRFDSIYRGIKESIPVGFAHRADNKLDIVRETLSAKFLTEVAEYEKSSIWNQKAIINQLGTLGGGNHFIELQKDDSGFVWIMIHSGSRNIGNKIATTYIKAAKALKNAPEDLEYFEVDSPMGQDYLKHMTFATNFAYMNRMIMIKALQKVLYKDMYHIGRAHPNFYAGTNIHHNYVNLETHFGEEVWVHRKGATRVSSGITGIIPGSMGSSSYIVQGTDNPDSYNSCSHGAGRCMSRTAARGKVDRKAGGFKSEGTLSVEDFKNDMTGIYTKDIDREHLDEAPRAYKPIDEVMENQKDLVNILVKLTPIMNVKG